MALQSGTLITEHVRLLEPLAEGGMGSVWKAEHLSLGMHVAVKFILSELIESNPTAVTRFEREAKAAAQIDSMHVVRMIDHGLTRDRDQTPYIVMELLRGSNLADWLELVQRLSLSQTVRLVTQVAGVLEKAHALGIVHRDIKPENIFIVDDEEELFVKVLDFGVAKHSRGAGARLTAKGVMVGTPHYMSPEQVISSTDIDARADIWALAAVAYEALSGELPFDANTLGELLVAVTNGEYLPITKLLPRGAPTDLDKWFARAFAKPLDERFQSAREMALSLKEIVHGGGQPAASTPRAALASEAAPTPSRPEPPRPQAVSATPPSSDRFKTVVRSGSTPRQVDTTYRTVVSTPRRKRRKGGQTPDGPVPPSSSRGAPRSPKASPPPSGAPIASSAAPPSSARGRAGNELSGAPDASEPPPDSVQRKSIPPGADWDRISYPPQSPARPSEPPPESFKRKSIPPGADWDRISYPPGSSPPRDSAPPPLRDNAPPPLRDSAPPPLRDSVPPQERETAPPPEPAPPPLQVASQNEPNTTFDLVTDEPARDIFSGPEDSVPTPSAPVRTLRGDGATYQRGKSVFEASGDDQQRMPEALFEEGGGDEPVASSPALDAKAPSSVGAASGEAQIVTPAAHSPEPRIELAAPPPSSRRLVQPAVSSGRPQAATPTEGRYRDVILACIVGGVAAGAVPLSSPTSRDAIAGNLSSSAVAVYGVVALLVAVAGIVLWSRTAKHSAPWLALAAFGALGQAATLGYEAARLASPELNIGVGQGTLTLVGVCGASLVVVGISVTGLAAAVRELRSGAARDLRFGGTVLGLSILGLVIALALLGPPVQRLIGPKPTPNPTLVEFPMRQPGALPAHLKGLPG